MKFIKRSAVAGVAIIAAVGLAGCGSTPGGAGGGDASAWALTGGSEPTFRSSFDRGTRRTRASRSAPELFANDAYKEKIRTAVGSDNAPTFIYSWAGGPLQDYVKNKDVVDLSTSTKALQARLIPSVLDSGKVDGKVYAVPNNNAQPVILYSNKRCSTTPASASRRPPSTTCSPTWPS